MKTTLKRLQKAEVAERSDRSWQPNFLMPADVPSKCVIRSASRLEGRSYTLG